MEYVIVNKRRYVLKRAGFNFLPGKNTIDAKLWEAIRELGEVKLQLAKAALVIHRKPVDVVKKVKVQKVQRMEKDLKPAKKIVKKVSTKIG